MIVERALRRIAGWNFILPMVILAGRDVSLLDRSRTRSPAEQLDRHAGDSHPQIDQRPACRPRALRRRVVGVISQTEPYVVLVFATAVP